MKYVTRLRGSVIIIILLMKIIIILIIIVMFYDHNNNVKNKFTNRHKSRQTPFGGVDICLYKIRNW